MNKYMELALKEAKKSLKHNDVPVGAVIVENDRVISKAHNKREKRNSITGHAELIAIEKACKKKKTWKLSECVLYVTLEPCMMCWAAINQARISKVIYSLPQEKRDVLDRTKKEQGDGQINSRKMLNKFFVTKRK